jgi:serine phosphatase RsbU (regulator of sigma subunit)
LASEAVGARRGLLMTIEDEALVVRARSGEAFRISKSISDRVLREKVSVVVADVAVDPNWELHQSIVSQGIRSLMAAPLQTDDRVIGLIYLDSTGTSRPFSSADLDLLTVMANVAAMRIERERLALVEKEQQFLESELRQAAEIQSQCLPAEAPAVAGYTLAGFSRPCRTVGGDYYGYFERSDGRVCIVLGDVAGKGMAAALLMMNLQARVQILAEVTDDPADIAERLNRTLKPICPSNRFVTLFVMILDPATGDLAFSNAGHEPALVVRAGGDVQPLLEGGPVIGLLANMPYDRGDCRLEPGDAVVLFTDGITEARGSGGEEFGTDRISEVFLSRKGASATQALESLESAVKTWLAGTSAHDDVTAVALVRAG